MSLQRYPAVNKNIHYSLFLKRPAHLPEGVSDAYYIIQEEIERTFRDVSPEAREGIFCIAYAMYSKNKKDLLEKSHGTLSVDLIRSLCASKDQIDKYCIEAFDRIKEISRRSVNDHVIGLDDIANEAVRNVESAATTAALDIVQTVKSNLDRTSRLNSRDFIMGVSRMFMEVMALVIILRLLEWGSPFFRWLFYAVVHHGDG